MAPVHSVSKHGVRPLSAGSANWTQISTGVSPAIRVDMTMAYDPRDGCVVLFGGVAYGTVYGDTWEYSKGVWTNITPSSPTAANTPSPRWGATMTYDAMDGYLLLFGGTNYSAVRPDNDTWKFSGGIWSNLTRGPTPSGRQGSSMAYDPAGGDVVMFGGENQTAPLGDTWTFHNGSWTNRSPSPSPRPRDYGAMTDDVRDGYVVLFGGYGKNGATNDTWSYANGTWVNRTLGSHIQGRYVAAMAYDAAEGYVVLEGGCLYPSNCASGYFDTWAFLNGSWKKLSPSVAPPGRWGDGSAFDAVDGYLMEFAGGNGANETWAYGSVVVLSTSEQPPVIDLGQTSDVSIRLAWPDPGLSYAYSGLPGGCHSSNVSTLACTPNESGTFEITINLTQGGWSYPSHQVALTVNSDPSVQRFTVTPSSLDAGFPVQFNASASGGTGRLSYSYGGLPANCTSRDVAGFSCHPTGGGNFSVVVTVADTLSFKTGATTALTVFPDPSVLSLEIIPSEIELGQRTTIAISANTSDGSLTFNYSGLPPGCTAPPGGWSQCVPTAVGNFTPTVNVRDSRGWSTSRGAHLSVLRQPSISAFSATPSILDIGQSATLSVSVASGAGWETVTFSGLPPGCQSSNSTLLPCTPTSEGVYRVRAQVQDALGGNAVSELNLTVNPRLAIAAFDPVPRVLDLGMASNLTTSITGGTAPWRYSYSQLPPGCVTSEQPIIHCTPTDRGTFGPRVTVVDAVGRSVSAAGQLIVNPPLSIGSFTVVAGPLDVGVNFTVIVASSGGTGPRAFAFLGLPAGCLTMNVSALTCAPAQGGQFNLTAVVSDAIGSVARANLVIVIAVPAAPQGSPTSGIIVESGVGLGAAGVAVAVALLWIRRRRGGRVAPGEYAPPEESEEPPYGMQAESDGA